jgi:nitrite reductase/ring-hydroxylating ferredoxin subunit/uncharacterized membrane protein
MATTVEDQELAKLRAATREAVTDRIEALEALDPAAEILQRLGHVVRRTSSRLESLLSGTWLGHPLHPPLTDVVAGAWTSSLVLDLVGGRRGRGAADTLVGVGVVAAVPTALAGLADAADLSGGARRVASIHALGNSTALAAYALSWLARRGGRRGTGRGLALLGFGLTTGSAWLGGHLSFRHGVGVNQTAFERLPSKWTAVLDDDELEDGVLGYASVDGTDVLLLRKGRKLHALADRCSHRGCSLHEGELENGTVVCPCHGSSFHLLDGRVVRGPAVAPQPVLEARMRGGRIEVRSLPSS